MERLIFHRVADHPVDLRSRYGIFSAKTGLVLDSPELVSHQDNYEPFSYHHSISMGSGMEVSRAKLLLESQNV